MSKAVFEILGLICLIMGIIAGYLANSLFPFVLGFGALLVLINIPGGKA